MRVDGYYDCYLCKATALDPEAEERQKAGLPPLSPPATAASAGPTPKDIFRAGFLAGCSFGMDQDSDDRMRHNDSPDVDQAWAEYEADHKAGQ